MKDKEILFEEKQYLGHNRLSMVIRTVLAIFCLTGYYWSENPKPVETAFFRLGSYPIQHLDYSGRIFFFLGISIMLLSVALTFVLHIQTTVYRGYVVVDGFWTSRKVKIDLTHIVSLRKSRYKKNIWRRAVYNLHNMGVIRFYTSGDEFVELIDDAGFTYRIGSQKTRELYETLRNSLQNNFTRSA